MLPVRGLLRSTGAPLLHELQVRRGPGRLPNSSSAGKSNPLPMNRKKDGSPLFTLNVPALTRIGSAEAESADAAVINNNTGRQRKLVPIAMRNLFSTL